VSSKRAVFILPVTAQVPEEVAADAGAADKSAASASTATGMMCDKRNSIKMPALLISPQIRACTAVTGKARLRFTIGARFADVLAALARCCLGLVAWRGEDSRRAFGNSVGRHDRSALVRTSWARVHSPGRLSWAFPGWPSLAGSWRRA
jgi:hypothetical protein